MKRRLIMWLLRASLVQQWLLYAAKPAPQPAEVEWTKEDARNLEGFLLTGTGQKLTATLENLKADADANAILRSNERTAFGLIGIARGVRVSVARIKALTAVRQIPDTTEGEKDSLPADLEHLSET